MGARKTAVEEYTRNEKRSISDGRLNDDYNKLMGYKWDGNVRELYHFLDRIYAEEQRSQDI